MRERVRSGRRPPGRQRLVLHAEPGEAVTLRRHGLVVASTSRSPPCDFHGETKRRGRNRDVFSSGFELRPLELQRSGVHAHGDHDHVNDARLGPGGGDRGRKAAVLTAALHPGCQVGRMFSDREAELGFARLAALSVCAHEFTEKVNDRVPHMPSLSLVWVAPAGCASRAGMTEDVSMAARATREIVPGSVSGGTNTSHTIIVAGLAALLDAVPVDAPASTYEEAALQANVIGKTTDGARRRTYRYLRELYVLRPDSLLFRAMRDLWPVDSAARPLLAGLCALARDAVFRASSSAITGSSPGDALGSADLADAVGEQFSESYGAATLAKIVRNTFSSWEQTGHLAEAEHATKVRTRATCRPANVAYALLLGYAEGVRGKALFETLWARVLDQPASHLMDLAASASQDGMLE